jgi:hypothetical protein
MRQNIGFLNKIGVNRCKMNVCELKKTKNELCNTAKEKISITKKGKSSGQSVVPSSFF